MRPCVSKLGARARVHPNYAFRARAEARDNDIYIYIYTGGSKYSDPLLRCGHAVTHPRWHVAARARTHARAHTPKVIHYCGSYGNAMKSCYMAFSPFSPNAYTQTRTSKRHTSGQRGCVCFLTFTALCLNVLRHVTCAKKKEERNAVLPV